MTGNEIATAMRHGAAPVIIATFSPRPCKAAIASGLEAHAVRAATGAGFLIVVEAKPGANGGIRISNTMFDWMLGLPWNEYKQEEKDLTVSEGILDSATPPGGANTQAPPPPSASSQKDD